MEFDQFAEKYKQLLDQSISISGEESEYFADYKARYLTRLLSRTYSGKVLDFGCGVGLLSGFLKRHMPMIQLDGFDPSGDSISRANPALTSRGLFTSDFDRLDRLYDLIVIANVMHHILPEQRLSTVQRLAARLHSWGKLVIFEHNPANPVTRWVVNHCPFDEDAVLLSADEVDSYLQQAGLHLSRRDYIVFLPRLLAWLRPLEPSLRWLPLGAQYVVVGEKHK